MKKNFPDEPIEKALKSPDEEKEQSAKAHRKVSLRRRLLHLVVVIWIVPIAILSGFVTVTYRNDIIAKTNQFMEDGIKNFTYFTVRRIDEGIDISKSVSYDMIIENAWKNYKAGNINSAELYRQIMSNLNGKLYSENRIVMCAFYLTDGPDHLYYKSRKDTNYIDIYKKDVAQAAGEISGQDTSDAFVVIIDGRIYIVRNLYTTTNYTKFGTLTMELDKSILVDGIALNKDYEYSFFINDTDSMISYNRDPKGESRDNIFGELKTLYSNNINGRISRVESKPYTGLLYQQKHDDYHFGAMLIANDSVIFSQLKNMYLAIGLIIMVVIPVLIYMVYFITHHITKPMSRMISAVNEMEQGRIGLQIGGEPMPNTEFDVLLETFNHMSSELKYLFDYAYNENRLSRFSRRSTHIF